MSYLKLLPIYMQIFFDNLIIFVIKRHGSVSCQMNAQRKTAPCIFTRAGDLSIWDRISIMIELIKFWVGLIDSLGLNYVIKVFLFFL